MDWITPNMAGVILFRKGDFQWRSLYEAIATPEVLVELYAALRPREIAHFDAKCTSRFLRDIRTLERCNTQPFAESLGRGHSDQ